MNVEWNIPFELTTPYGTFPLNDAGGTSGVSFVLDPTKCAMFAGIRETSDPKPQAHGSILHREFSEGFSMRLGGWIMLDRDTPACDADLRAGVDELQLHLNALYGADHDLDGDNARIQWTPSSYGQDRLLGDIRLLEELVPTFDPAGGPTEFSFAVHSPFPYALDQAETITSLSATISNPGNCVVYPNFKVHGPVSSFLIINETTGQVISYDDSFPGAVPIGGGDYAFIGCFANNIFLNGSGSNLMAGIDVETSEFFGLYPGPNQITIDGGVTAEMIWNAGWV